MASSFCVWRLLPSSLPHRPNGLRLASPSPVPVSLRNGLSLSKSLFGSRLILPSVFAPVPSGQTKPLTVVAAKGYKMKTHKASAKRFRVTGRGKIVRRKAGKQHLLAKKNRKRKLRLSKMAAVHRSDYDNVISTLPYLKVNRKAT